MDTAERNTDAHSHSQRERAVRGRDERTSRKSSSSSGEVLVADA